MNSLSDREIENYLALVSSLLRLSAEQREEIGCELRDHLQTRVEALRGAGKPQAEAVRAALSEFGDAAGLAVAFVSIVQRERRRWIMRWATLTMAASFVAAVVLMAWWPAQPRFGSIAVSAAPQESAGGTAPQESTDPRYAQERERDEATRRGLDTIIDVDVRETPAADVLETLQQLGGVTMVLRDCNELSRETPLTFHAAQVRLRTALDLLLESYQATYTIRDGLVVIDDIDECPTTVRVFRLPEALQNEDPDQLIQLIHHCVQSPAWDSGAGHLQPFNGSLVARAHEPDLYQIGRLLDALQQSSGGAVPAQSLGAR